MKKNGWQSLVRVLLLSIMILLLISLSSLGVFAEESGARNDNGCAHVDLKSASGITVLIGYNSTNTTFAAFENESLLSTFLASNAKLYESITYGESTVTAEALVLAEGKTYQLGFADILGNMVYFSGEVSEHGTLLTTNDLSLAARIIAVPDGDGYALGVSTEAGTRYLAISRGASGACSLELVDSARSGEIYAEASSESELRSRFTYDGETLSVVFTRFVADNVCDECGVELPGFSDGELTTIIIIASIVALIVAAFLIIRAIIRRRSVGYLFDNNGFR